MNLKFNVDGLIPVVTQDYYSKDVLMLAYANEEAVKKTIETGNAWYFSRSRKKLWEKGEESGNTQEIRGVFTDCDQDTLLYLVEQTGEAACHNGTWTCFEETLKGDKSFGLFELEKVIGQRAKEKPEGSYTVKLLENEQLALEKVREESAEVLKAAESEGKQRLIEESVDLLYHWLVLVKQKGLSLDEVIKEMEKRHK